MTPLMQALSIALVHFLWQGMVVGLALWAALRLLRHAPAQSRYLAGCGALLIMAMLPVVTAMVVYTGPAPAAIPSGSVPAIVSAGPLSATVETSRVASWMRAVEPWAVPVWSLGVLLFSLRLVWACLQISTMKRRGEEVEAALLAVVSRLRDRLDLRSGVHVLKTAADGGPSVVGWIRPVVLLPASALLGLTPQQLEAVLAHELAHIRRHDHIVNAVQSLIETVLFYHPAVWWASASIRHERELCCDDLAVTACGDAICYARALTKLERLRVMTPAGELGSTGGALGYRIRRLLGMSNREYGPSKWHGILALALGLTGVALNVNWAQEKPKEMTPYQNIAVAFHPTADPASDSRGVTVDLRGASLVHRTGVEYPETAMKAGVVGTVTVEVTLDAGGQVSDARVLSGPIELRKAVIGSVLQWHFAAVAAGTQRSVNVIFQKPPAGSFPNGKFAPLAAQKLRDVDEVLAGSEPQSRGAAVTNLKARGQVVTVYQADPEHVAKEREAQRQAEIVAERGEQAAKTLELRRQIELVDQDYRKKREQYSENHPDVLMIRNKLTELRRMLEGMNSQEQAVTHNVAMLADQQKIMELKRLEVNRNWIVGARVQAIEMEGISEQARTDLLSRLPVHIGDTLAATSMESTSKAIRAYDEHLRLNVVRGDGGQAVIRIVPMPEGRK